MEQNDVYLDVAISVYAEMASQQQLSRSRDSLVDPAEELRSAAQYALIAATIFVNELKGISERSDA